MSRNKRDAVTLSRRGMTKPKPVNPGVRSSKSENVVGGSNPSVATNFSASAHLVENANGREMLDRVVTR